MNYLDWNHLTSHGSGIKCSWLEMADADIAQVISQDSREKILDWIKSNSNTKLEME